MRGIIKGRRRTAGARTGLAALAALLLVLAACSGEVDEEADAAPEPTQEQEPDEAATPEPESAPASDEDDEPAGDEEGEGRTTVSVYFPRDGHGDPCGDVLAVPREVAASDPIGEAIYALLEGPTEAEREDGYGGWFSDETADMLHGYRSDDGILYVDFEDFSSIIPNASTSCGSAALLAQLDHTLEQFESIGEPRYSFDGDVAAFYEWLQLAPPEE